MVRFIVCDKNSCLRNWEYGWGILAQLKWESLKKRRKDNSLILLYNKKVQNILLGINIEQCSSPHIGGILHNYEDKKNTNSINTQYVMNSSFKVKSMINIILPLFTIYDKTT